MPNACYMAAALKFPYQSYPLMRHVPQMQGLEKSVLQIKRTYSWIWAFFWEKNNKMDKTESYIFNADNAELGNFLKDEKKTYNTELTP